MGDEWFYSTQGRVGGPVALDTLVEMARDGLLQPSDRVRQGSGGDWLTADMLGDLRFVPAEPEVAANLSDLAITFGDTGAAASAPAAASVDEPGDAWHGRSLGAEFGPMPFAEVVRMASDGLLGGQDEVRRAGEPAWVKAGELPELAEAILLWELTSERAGPRESSPARISLTASVTAPPIPLPRGPAAPKESVEGFAEASSAGSSSMRTGQTPPVARGEAASDARSRSRTNPPGVAPRPLLGNRVVAALRRRARTIGLCVGLVAAAGILIPLSIVGWRRGPGAARDRALVEQVVRVYREFCELRERGASDSQWAEFQSAALAELEPLQRRLEGSTLRPQSARLYALDALRDFEPTIRQGRHGPVDVERTMVSRLNRARLVLDPKAERVIVPGVGPFRAGAPGAVPAGNAAAQSGTATRGAARTQSP